MFYYRRLRDLREDHDLTQKQVAELIKTTQQVYSEYEKGRQSTLSAFTLISHHKSTFHLRCRAYPLTFAFWRGRR